MFEGGFVPYRLKARVSVKFRLFALSALAGEFNGSYLDPFLSLVARG